MSSEQFALFLRVIRAPVFGRAYSAAPPTRFHAHLYQILRKLEAEGRKYFDFKPHVVLTDLPDDAAQISELADLNARIRTDWANRFRSDTETENKRTETCASGVSLFCSAI
jgi:hypothetical protein